MKGGIWSFRTFKKIRKYQAYISIVGLTVLESFFLFVFIISVVFAFTEIVVSICGAVNQIGDRETQSFAAIVFELLHYLILSIISFIMFLTVMSITSGMHDIILNETDKIEDRHLSFSEIIGKITILDELFMSSIAVVSILNASSVIFAWRFIEIGGDLYNEQEFKSKIVKLSIEIILSLGIAIVCYFIRNLSKKEKKR